MSASTWNRIRDKLKKIDATEDKYNPNADYSAFKVPHWFYKTDEWNKLEQGQCNFFRQNPRQKPTQNGDKEFQDYKRANTILKKNHRRLKKRK